MSNLGFRVFKPDTEIFPIIINISHSGSVLPRSEEHFYKPEEIKRPVDTDWYLDRVYKFAPTLGITTIRANYSRFLIDLDSYPDNRVSEGQSPGELNLCPPTTYDGKSIYLKKYLKEKDILERLNLYYWPYYHEVENLIKEFKSKFKKIILCDVRSVKSSSVSFGTTSPIVVNHNFGDTCSAEVSELIISSLKNDHYKIEVNKSIFENHFIKYFGKPEDNVHAVQIILTQDTYLNEENLIFDEGKCDLIRSNLITMFKNIANF